jgi:hypothetical protein
MVRVFFLVLAPAMLLSACAGEQQASGSLAKEIVDCVPNPTLADVWSCATKKHNPDATPAAETRGAGQKTS